MSPVVALHAHLQRLDARANAILRVPVPTDEQISELDVLCASIAEVSELLAEGV